MSLPKLLPPTECLSSKLLPPTISLFQDTSPTWCLSSRLLPLIVSLFHVISRYSLSRPRFFLYMCILSSPAHQIFTATSVPTQITIFRAAEPPVKDPRVRHQPITASRHYLHKVVICSSNKGSLCLEPRLTQNSWSLPAKASQVHTDLTTYMIT